MGKFEVIVAVLFYAHLTCSQQQAEKAEEEPSITLHTVRRNQDFSTDDFFGRRSQLPNGGGALDGPSQGSGAAYNPSFGRRLSGDRQRLDGITVLLQRIGDRLLAIEAAQVQRAERIDSVHYRMTRLEVSGEEHKAAIEELSGAVRHRLQTSDFELEKIRDSLDGLGDSLIGLSAQSTRIQAYLEARQAFESSAVEAQESSQGGARLKAVLAGIHAVRGISQQLRHDVGSLLANVTSLTNVTKSLDYLTDNGVTKPFLRSSLAEYRRQAVPSGAFYPQPSFARPSQPRLPIDCYEVQERLKKASSATNSGVYLIQPVLSDRPFFAYCDLKTEGGGWTVLQRRLDGSVDFQREWLDYKYGFGNLAGEFWLGNDHIHALTNQRVTELRIELGDFSQEVAIARYSAFAIGNEEEGYALKLLGHYSGDAGDSLSYHVGQRWSTTDSDSDAWPENNCAKDHRGAWWYRACDTSNLNGLYLHGPVPADHEYQGTYWYDFRGPLYSLWKTTMMVRRGGSVTEPVLATTGTRRRAGVTPTDEAPNLEEEEGRITG